MNGVSIKKMKEGYSKPRNRAIASAFAYMKIIEKWGSGIPRMLRECKGYGLPEPKFIDFDGDFRVNMFRNTEIGSANGDNYTIFGTIDTKRQDEEKILELIRNNPRITQNLIKEQTDLSLRTVKRIMADLQKSGRVNRIGNNRSGKWQVNE